MALMLFIHLINNYFIVIKTTPIIAVNIDIILSLDILSFKIINESTTIKTADV